MKRLFMAAMVVFAAAGCGKKDDAEGKMKGFRDSMCKCAKDKDPAACAAKIAEAQDKFEEGMSEPSGAEEEKLEALKKEMRVCQRAIE